MKYSIHQDINEKPGKNQYTNKFPKVGKRSKLDTLSSACEHRMKFSIQRDCEKCKKEKQITSMNMCMHDGTTQRCR